MALVGKSMPARVQKTEETLVPTLGREDPLVESEATYSSILAWWAPWGRKE